MKSGRTTINKFLVRGWRSPTLMTWSSNLARLSEVVVILPVVLTSFTAPEIAVYQLFLMVTALNRLADLSFTATFARALAYGLGGANDIGEFRNRGIAYCGQPNWVLIGRIVKTMRLTYAGLAVGLLVFWGAIGSILLYRPIENLADSGGGWHAWGLVVITVAATMAGRIYVSYLQGTNQIAEWRRAEAVTFLGGALSALAAVWFGGGLLAVMIAQQSWRVANVLYNRYLCYVKKDLRFLSFGGLDFDRQIFKKIWSRCWKSGVGIWFGAGVINSTGFAYAQIADANAVGGYLLALQLINAVVMFSTAPMQSKLPRLNRLRTEGRHNELECLAQSGMRVGYWTFVLGAIGIAMIVPEIVYWLKSDIDFVTPLIWCTLAIAFFVQRYGAMHLQLYTTTNHVIWHVANGITGVIQIISCIILYPWLESYAFPVSFLLGYVSFYSWYIGSYSYAILSLDWWSFERRTSFPPFLTLLVFSIAYLSFR